MTKTLDLNDLIKHPAATFLIRVLGDFEGVSSGDLLIVDRAIEPADGHIVVAIIEGEFTLKKWPLKAAELWGTVTHLIRSIS